jgi:hypothetical protein
MFFVISVKDIDGGIDQDIFDINQGLWLFILFYYNILNIFIMCVCVCVCIQLVGVSSLSPTI